MHEENRVHTMMYDAETDCLLNETVSSVMVDFHCDCTANTDLLWDITPLDKNQEVIFTHKLITIPLMTIPPLIELNIPDIEDNLPKVETVIYYEGYNEYTHNGQTIFNLEGFVKSVLLNGDEIEFKFCAGYDADDLEV